MVTVQLPVSHHGFLTRSIHTTDWLFFSTRGVLRMDLSTERVAPLSRPQKQKHGLQVCRTRSRNPDNTTVCRLSRQEHLTSAHDCLWCHHNKITVSYMWKVCLEEQTGCSDSQCSGQMVHLTNKAEGLKSNRMIYKTVSRHTGSDITNSSGQPTRILLPSWRPS